MHPSELKNQALVAALMAERDGFKSTAEAFRLMAIACAAEARDLLLDLPQTGRAGRAATTGDRLQNFEVLF